MAPLPVPITTGLIGTVESAPSAGVALTGVSLGASAAPVAIPLAAAPMVAGVAVKHIVLGSVVSLGIATAGTEVIAPAVLGFNSAATVSPQSTQSVNHPTGDVDGRLKTASQLGSATMEDKNMRNLLLASTLLAGMGAAPAMAQTASSCTTDASGNVTCDPTAFHVTGPGATGSDPVVLHDSTTFTVNEVGNHTIDPPTTIFFATVVGQTGPTVTSYSFDGGADVPFGGVLSNEGIWTPTNGAGGDLYSFVGCTGCDGSLNKTNVDAIETLLGFGAGQTFQVNNLVLPVGWTGAPDSLTVNGSFSLGTIIAPLAENVETMANGHIKTTFFDTSWTNTGVIGGVIPEPSTWVMMGVGFALLGGIGWRRAHTQGRLSV